MRKRKWNIVAIGITNQRETTIAWDKHTGKPLYNAIVWQDARTSAMCEEWAKKAGSRDAFRDVCGLPISSYFSATKMKWYIDNVPEIREAIAQDRLLFGTIDTWLIWNLTGGPRGGQHLTDVTNASRTMLMSLRTKRW